MAQIPEVTFQTFDKGWGSFSSLDIIQDKRIVIFALPGAFTPICSNLMLPAYEEAYDEILDQMIDEVYCLSVNDCFVMNAWFDQMGIEKVKSIADGNGEFTNAMGMSIPKTNRGFGFRSWRYAMVVDNGEIEMTFVEDGRMGNCPSDPYLVSDPSIVLKYLKSK